MARSINPAVWELWRDRLSRFDVGGQTVAQWCREEGVSQAAFYQWRKKLGGSLQQNAEQKPTAAFVPVMMESRDTVEAAVVMTLPAGVRVEVPADCGELAVRLLRAAAEISGENS